MYTKVLLLFHFRSCDRPADQSFAWLCAAPVARNYTVRLYRPRTEVLNGSWEFPEPQPVE
ncbi:MAG: hypothetical protein E5V35_10400 [Mesorhizobium sp.]|nr:MAG: hypothetical protein E5V35_10400 [Mesorhizobium sp.]